MVKLALVGDQIYVPTFGERFIGGLATVISVNGNRIAVKEYPGLIYRWEKNREHKGVAERQDELKEQFGDQLAYTKKCSSKK